MERAKFRLFLVHYQTFFSEGIPHPLVEFVFQFENALTSFTARLSASLMRLLVTRANPAKNYPVKAFIASTVTFFCPSSIIPRLVATMKRRKSLMLARSRGGTPSRRLHAFIVWEASTAASSVFPVSCSCFCFSTAVTHLFYRVSTRL